MSIFFEYCYEMSALLATVHSKMKLVDNGWGTRRSQLRLLRLERRQQQVPDVAGCLVQEEAHPLAP